MTFKISGFGAFQKDTKDTAPAYETYQQTVTPRYSKCGRRNRIV